MHAFLVGLLFVIGLAVLSLILGGIGFLLFPVIVVMGILLKVAIIFILVIGCIWLIGKLILLIIESIKK